MASLIAIIAAQSPATHLTQALLVFTYFIAVAKFRRDLRVIILLSSNMFHLLTMPADPTTNLMAIILAVFQMTSLDNPHTTGMLGFLLVILNPSAEGAPLSIKIFTAAIGVFALVISGGRSFNNVDTTAARLAASLA